MQDFPIRFSIVSDAYSAGRSWFIGEPRLDSAGANLPHVDLGNGSELSASDVVESHFVRMVSGSQDVASDQNDAVVAATEPSRESATESAIEPASPDVSEEQAETQCSSESPAVDTESNRGTADHSPGTLGSLHRAIGGLAPPLLPLIQLAEELFSANPPVSPKQEFRSLLLAALQAEHKQTVNKMAIGIQQPEPDPELQKKGRIVRWALLCSIPIALALYLFIRKQRRARKSL